MSNPLRPGDELASLIYRYYYLQLRESLGDLRLFNDGYALFERLGGRYAAALERDLPELFLSGPVAFVAKQLFGSDDYQRLIDLARSLERVKTAVDAILAHLAPEADSLSEEELLQRYEREMTIAIPPPEAFRIVNDVRHGLQVINRWFHPTNLLQRGRRVLIERLIDRALAGEDREAHIIKDRILRTIREDPKALPELGERFAALEQTYLSDLYRRHAATPD